MIILVTGILCAAAVAGMAWRLPPAFRESTVRRVLVVLIWGPPPPRHALDQRDTRTAQARWDDGPQSMDLASERAARYCAGLPALPRPTFTQADLDAMTARWQERQRDWAEPRPLLMLPRPEGAEGPARVPQTDGAGLPPGAWRRQIIAALTPPGAPDGPPGAHSGPLPPGGDQLPPDDFDQDAAEVIERTWDHLADRGVPPGSMRWNPGHLPESDWLTAELAAQDHQAAIIREGITRRTNALRAAWGLQLVAS